MTEVSQVTAETNSPDSAQTPPAEPKVTIAIISNEPTPYRLHVLHRAATELPEAEIHNIFTHTITTPSFPWRLNLTPEMNPIFFEDCALGGRSPFSLRGITQFRKVRDFLIAKKVRMIILLGYNDLCRLLLIHWARRKGIPLILTSDSNIMSEGRLSWRRRFVKRLYVRWVLRRLSGLMPMGTCGRAFFRLYYDHDLPEFIFPYEPDYTTLWHYTNEDLGAFLQNFGLAPTRRRLLYCGRLVRVKRVDLLIRAFVKIAPHRPMWDLVIAGDGPLRKELEAMIPPELKDRVKWLGFLQFAEAAISYRACEVLVHPAEYEPWGLVIVEAVACERAVITTSIVGAAVEMVKHNVNGLIVPPRNVDALADAMAQITLGQRAFEMSWPCGAMLEAWRRQADPIDSIRDAMRYLHLISSEHEFKTVCEELWRPKPKADNQKASS